MFKAPGSVRICSLKQQTPRDQDKLISIRLLIPTIYFCETCDGSFYLYNMCQSFDIHDHPSSKTDLKPFIVVHISRLFYTLNYLHTQVWTGCAKSGCGLPCESMFLRMIQKKFTRRILHTFARTFLHVSNLFN